MSEFEVGPKRAVYGICVHTTGSGIPNAVAKSGKPHLEVARETYLSMGLVGPHYVIDPYGHVEQYADVGVVRYHVGVLAEHRRSFLDGHWLEDKNRIPADVVAWWQARWPGVKSPSHLYPSKSANKDYVGIELIPCGRYLTMPGIIKPQWRWEHGSRPGFDFQRFSVEQYCALAKLCNSIAEENGLDLTKRGVLVGHEDVNPYTRPGWDPGSKIEAFSWNLLNGLLKHVQP
jgi:N-acetyl-anhydromuramyl-L-alanine amidase AmpD